jgi:glycosyltransferase involved in cell wall biosynthesis
MMDHPIDRFSRTIVVPIYKSQDHIPKLFEYIQQIGDAVGEVEIVFVIDGTPDNSEQRIFLEAKKYAFKIKVVRLSRNFGVGPALHAALSHVTTSSLVIIGADLQEPVELYIDFFRRLESGEADVFLGERLSRDDPFSMRFFSAIFWWVNRKFINSDTPKGGFDGVGLSAKASKTLAKLPELNTSFTSQLQWIGYKQVFVPFHRVRRQSGKSSWTYKRKVKLFADSVYGFTGAPIAILTILGVVSTVLMVFVLFATLFASIMGWMVVPGYATIVILSALGHSVTIMGLGILGGYVHRSFENTKGRPRFVIEKVYEIEQSESPEI